MANQLEKFKDAADKYLRDCQVEMSPATVQNYAERLGAFLSHMEEEGFSSIGPTEDAVISWKRALSVSGLALSTIHQYLTELRTFFSWCVDMKYYEHNPVLPRFIPSSSRQPYQKLLTQEEIMDLLSSERPKGIRKWSWNRNRAMAILFLTAALRNSELAALRLCDLDFDAHTITVVRGKGGKFRMVSFPDIAVTAVQAYLHDPVRPSWASDTAPLFGIEHDGNWQPMSRVGISEIINRFVRQMTQREGIRSHALRHASASIMLSGGMRMEDIQPLLGHSSVKTTEVYASLLNPAVPSIGANKVFAEMERQALRGQQEMIHQKTLDNTP